MKAVSVEEKVYLMHFQAVILAELTANIL